jgi:molybdopterin/thiamine biosynthesis adenylyltransferase
MAEQLALLGVEDFLFLDPDKVEPTNLNRLFGASKASIGQPKVNVARGSLASVRPAARVLTFQESVLDVVTAKRLLDVDFFFCCTDSHGSRAVLSQLAYQYLVPGIDMGVSIAAKHGVVTHVSGRVQMLAPGLPCLTCTQLLNPDAVRWDFMPQDIRRLDPYFVGEGEPQPSVVTINSVVASLASTMFLGAVAHVPLRARFQLYDGIRGTVRAIEGRPEAGCLVCSDAGALSRGDEWPLIGRPT